jgi:DNA repair protein RecN (Recombination protein N)
LIETLRIGNLAIVESEQVEFGPGLNVLTGETGAGKSIVLGALSLLAGSRVSPQMVREGCEEAVVEAVFRTDHLPDLESRLEALGLVADEHELVVQRSVQRGGRSRARVAGQLVPAAVLAELFSGQIEISSQHDSQSLLRTEFHGRLLDTAAGLLPLRGAVADGYAKLRALDAELAELRAAERERERRRDFLSFQVGEIDDARLDVDEGSALRAERSRLVHAERLSEEASAALMLLAGDFGGSEVSNTTDLVSEAIRHLEGIEALDSALAPLLAGLCATREELRDTATELERYAAGIEVDPARLEVLDERLAQIEALQRKYGGSITEVLRFRDAAAAELEQLEGASARAHAIDALRSRQVEQLKADAERLSKGRRTAGKRLGTAVQTALREMAMPQARFEVALARVAAPEASPCGPGGFESPEFQFAASAGGELLPLRRAASGGELSRTFLAIKSAIREADAGMVLVFDEVDAGIGGRTADRVGRCLAELAGRHQVLCITHLPQIAAYASAHFRVEKCDVEGRPSARLLRVEGADRVEEIARMAGGEEVGESTRRHAQELIRSRSPL